MIGFSLGIRYGDEWGHRGATHSFAFSIALGLAIGLAARLARSAPSGPAIRRAGRAPRSRTIAPAVRTAVIASAVLVSHALLDTLTDGGLGCALLWPFDLTRYFAPWNPIPVAPIGWSFLSAYGLGVALTELILFSPVFWFALSPARTTTLTALHGVVPRSLAGRGLVAPTDRRRHRQHRPSRGHRVRRRLLGTIVSDDQTGSGCGRGATSARPALE